MPEKLQELMRRIQKIQNNNSNPRNFIEQIIKKSLHCNTQGIKEITIRCDILIDKLREEVMELRKTLKKLKNYRTRT